jgi:hypothetical protein
VTDLEGGADPQARATAEVVQRVRPDVLLLNEFDYDADGKAARILHDEYFAVSQNGQEPVEYGYRYVSRSNTGVDSGFDLDNDGKLHTAADAHGFGDFEGQFAFVVYSRYPIARAKIRTFGNFLWKDMPGAVFPKKGSKAWYTKDELAVLRLSSKNHVDLPIDIAGTTVHLLAHHPTPPAFDGSEDRNGFRNEAEIRFWADYLNPEAADYIVDDAGVHGGLPENEHFVIEGDHNADPNDGSGRPGAIEQLLDHGRVNVSLTPSSAGAARAAEDQGGANDAHAGDPAEDTGDFGDGYLGNLRLDYVLPSSALEMLDAQVFWPLPDAPEHALIEHSDHRMVWVDLRLY